MQLEDLKRDWQNTIQAESAPENLPEMIETIQQQTIKIDQEVKRRDFLEISIAVLLVPFWILGLFISVSSMQTVGYVIALAACAIIPYRLISAKRIEVRTSDSIKTFLLQEKQKLAQQKQILESIAWWYIGPIATAILLITLGANVDESGVPQIPEHMMWYYICLAILVIGVYALNRQAAHKKFGPLLDNVNTHLADIEQSPL